MSLSYWFVRRVFKYTAPVLGMFEPNNKTKLNEASEKVSPVFIIGVPRSGTTYLYQLITSFYNVSYVNNLVYAIREHPLLGFKLSHALFKNKQHRSFESDYGNTFKSGFNAPNEGGLIWTKWFPESIAYFERTSLPESQKLKFKAFVKYVAHKFEKPFVIKNLFFAQRIKIINELFPNAKFIFIKRKPEYIAQSILIAKNKNKEGEWWSVKPKNYLDIIKLSIYEQAVMQVFYIEKQINEDLKLFPEENIQKINYEDLIENPNNILKDLENFLNIKLFITNKINSANNANKIKLDHVEFVKIVDIVKKLDWDEYK